MTRDDADELEDLLGQYVDRLNDGERLDLEAVLAENPVHGPKIVEHLESFIESTVEREEPLGALGDYTLLRQIGRGGMGVVYEAWQRSMDRRVALKVLPAGLLADKRAVVRFRREAKLAGRLHHPNVVSAFGIGVEGGTPCFAMEFVDGETLEQVLRRSGPSGSQDKPNWKTWIANSFTRAFFAETPTQQVPPPGLEPLPAGGPLEDDAGDRALPSREIDLKYCLRMAESFAGAADGLQHAHGHGIIHRDLKPSNLILDKEVAGHEPYLGSSAETRLGRGVARLESLDFVGAIEDFIAARALWPESLEPGLLLAKAYFLQGNRDRAEETFKGLLERARIHDEVATLTAALYSSLSEYELGLQWAEKVRDVPIRERLRSALLYNLGRLEEAREAGKRAVEANCHDARAYLVLAQADYAGGAPISELVRKAVEVDPTNATANVWLAHDLTTEGKPDEAQVRLQSALRFEPRSPFGHCALARVLEQKGELLAAFSAYTKAIEIAPQGLAPLVGTSVIQLLRRKEKPRLPVGELIRILEKALATNPHNPASLLRLLAAAKIHDPDGADAVKALEYARLAVETTGRTDPDMLWALAEAQFVKGDRAEAVRTLEEAVRLPDASRRLLSDLEEYRRALAPRMVSFASIDAALEAPEVETLIPEGASWRLFRGRKEPSPALEWTEPAFDDSSWSSGTSGFGYGDGDDATLLEDMMGSYTTLYVRNLFSLADPSRYRRILLSVRADDGFVAYLNAVEVGRARAGKAGARVPCNGTATVSCETPTATEIWLDSSLFQSGENCLAIQGLNISLGSSDLTLVPVLEGEVLSGPQKERKLLESLRPEVAGAGDAVLLSYLEAALLARAGEHRQAAAGLSAIVDGGADRPEPLLRLTGSLAAAGDPAAAEARLREALARGPCRDREVWDRWLELSLVALGRTVAELLAAFPGAREPLDGYGADIRWLLERLQADEPIRIRCGGEEYRSRKGSVWGKDRFHLSGHPYNERKGEDPLGLPGGIARTDDDPLYLSERHFLPDDIHAPAYRVPLPPAEYEVTLHFAEIVHRTKGRRRFDVLLEGTRVLEDYDPGIGVAKKHTFRATVTDGFLDIEFGFVMEYPKVSAIKIERLTRR